MANSSVEDVAKCARILFQLTMNWSAADKSDATLAGARADLAATILATDGQGFPPPASDGLINQPDLKETWKACVAAARVGDTNVAPQGGFPENVLFWTADPRQPDQLGNTDGLDLQWPLLGGTRKNSVSGPLSEGTGDAKRLFFYDTIDPEALALDGDAGPGFWPRSSGTLASVSNPPRPSQRRPVVGTLLFTAWASISAGTAVWAWFAAEYVHKKGADQPWLKFLFSPRAVDDGHISLLLPYAIVMISMILLAMASGMATRGLWFGAFISDRNRLSLSRVQQWAWSVMLLGSLGWTGWFNAVFGGDPELFPTMDNSLWAALGINLAVTPLLSKTILATKQDDASTAKADSQKSKIVTPAQLDANASAREASWVDLITGETAGTENTVDISRLQHLVISGILLTAYMIALAKMYSFIDPSKLPFTELPHVGTTFLGLLCFSHAGYLVFKAGASDETGSAALRDDKQDRAPTR